MAAAHVNHEELLSKVSSGTQAQVCLGWMEPIFDKCEKAIIANLKGSYRGGKYDESILASGVASLCTIEDLKSMLSGMVRTGEGAHKKIEETDGRTEY